tara:strand:- start:7041 stop:7319 length:279 start_codon:yes stop_codon:yes gene_type:complete
MASKRKVELFTAGCLVCEDTVKMVKDMACESCEVIVYNLNEACNSEDCLDKVKKFGIKRLPAVVVDGKIADCCLSSGPTVEGLKAAGVGVFL